MCARLEYLRRTVGGSRQGVEPADVLARAAGDPHSWKKPLGEDYQRCDQFAAGRDLRQTRTSAGDPDCRGACV